MKLIQSVDMADLNGWLLGIVQHQVVLEGFVLALAGSVALLVWVDLMRQKPMEDSSRLSVR